MKLIIDISDDVYKKIIADKYAIYDRMYYSIKNGIPLDKIRAEIDEIPLSEPMVSADGLYCYGSKSITMWHFREKVLDIIDKYKGEQP